MKQECLSHREIEQLLRDAGIQPTAQRIAIYRYVLCEADHPTAEDVKHWADENFPKVSLATVYNTLATFVKADLLKEFRFPGSGKVIYDSNTSDHFHFIDEGKERIIDLAPEDVELKLCRDDLDVSDVNIVFTGKSNL